MKHSLFLVGIFSVFALPIFASEPEVPETEMVVTATRTKQVVSDSPSAISVIASEEISKAPNRSLGDLLRDIPGVSFQNQANPGMVRLRIRGESPRRVLLLIDGLKLSEQKSMNGAPLLMSAANVERIEVVRGPGSVLYGSEAIGGVINVITKKGGKKPLEGSLDLGYDSASDGWSSSLRLAGQSGGFEYSLTGSWMDHDDREAASGSISHTDYEMLDGALYLGYRDDEVHMGIRYDRHHSRLASGSVYDETTLQDFSADVPAWDREALSAFMEWQDLTPHLSRLLISAYWQRTFKKFEQMAEFNGYPFTPFAAHVETTTENRLDTYGASIQLDWQFGAHLLTTGFDFSRDVLDAESTGSVSFFSVVPSPGMMTTPINTWDDAVQTSYAIFARDEWAFADDWILDLGVRNTWIESNLHESDTPGADSPKDWHSVFSVALINRSVKDLALRLGFSQAYRFPSLQELYAGSTSSLDGARIVANPELDPEVAQSVEIGGRYDNGVLTVDASVFYSHSEDSIGWREVTAIPQNYYMYDNIGDTDSYGLELVVALNLSPTDNLLVVPYLNGTWMRREIELEGEKTFDTGLPIVQGRVGVRGAWQVRDDFSSWFDLYVRAATACDDEANVETPDFLRDFAGWGTLNLEAGCQVGEEETGRPIWRVSAGLENLFDQDYRVAGEFVDAPGRGFFVKLGCDF